MSKTKKPRKQYRPRPVANGGGLAAFARIYARGENASPLRDDQLTDLGAAYWVAMENLTSGSASEESWSCVVCSLNIAMALCESVFNGQHEEDIIAAMDGAFRAKIRSEKSGNFRLDGDAIQAINFALTLHDKQMQLAHRKEIVAALETVQRRVKEGNVYTVDNA